MADAATITNEVKTAYQTYIALFNREAPSV